MPSSISALISSSLVRRTIIPLHTTNLNSLIFSPKTRASISISSLNINYHTNTKPPFIIINSGPMQARDIPEIPSVPKPKPEPTPIPKEEPVVPNPGPEIDPGVPPEITTDPPPTNPNPIPDAPKPPLSPPGPETPLPEPDVVPPRPPEVVPPRPPGPEIVPPPTTPPDITPPRGPRIGLTIYYFVALELARKLKHECL